MTDTETEVEMIEDFGAFVKGVKSKNTYTVEFEVGKEDYSFKYSELTSAEESAMMKEFARWYKDNYQDESSKDKELSLTQYRYFKMLQKHAKGLETFDTFLSMPRLIIGAIAAAIEDDMLVRYPHLQKQFANYGL